LGLALLALAVLSALQEAGAATGASDPAGLILSQTVFQSGQDGYHTYRIPALIVTPRGSVLAFCEGCKTGPGDHGDLDLLMKRSTDGGATWSAISQENQLPCPIGSPAST